MNTTFSTVKQNISFFLQTTSIFQYYLTQIRYIYMEVAKLLWLGLIFSPNKANSNSMQSEHIENGEI